MFKYIKLKREHLLKNETEKELRKETSDESKHTGVPTAYIPESPTVSGFIRAISTIALVKLE